MSQGVEIPLTRGAVAIVDPEDARRVLAEGSWYLSVTKQKRYAARNLSGGGHIRLHTFLTGWDFVDHGNGNGLDNRRHNLRPATPSENGANRGMAAANTSGYRGVSFHRASGLWRAYIGGSATREWLGYFSSPEEAARAYDAAALARWGEFAHPNFPSIECVVLP